LVIRKFIFDVVIGFEVFFDELVKVVELVEEVRVMDVSTESFVLDCCECGEEISLKSLNVRNLSKESIERLSFFLVVPSTWENPIC
jgi:hypothetical protein